MESSSNGGNRLDRIEGIIEALATRQADIEEAHIQIAAEHKRLLTAQVLLTDEVRKFQQRTEEKFQQLADMQRSTDERLNTLIAIVDGLIRRPPPQ